MERGATGLETGGRSIGLVKRFQAYRYSGCFSSTLMKPITLRLAKGTPLTPAADVSGALRLQLVSRHVPIILDTGYCKSRAPRFS